MADATLWKTLFRRVLNATSAAVPKSAGEALPHPEEEKSMDFDFQECLRDRFAMSALIGIVSKETYAASDKEDQQHLARCAYEIADAMLKARKSKEK